ncbi:uncharacterized protein LOC105702642 [Orussus abietinus]|uniref:uncharacterized protein LOC105702642 n=1 Tax=Orussus abietinus TaxID=222816 RepID=UPI000C716053|nr:uncharacterized protein LOC105702642 [Orussus abietinus]XP_023289206.1 uncharacterized protein LOC105702642 [Orussus abietinus]XP_023289207.1 uncharacterized protein LOC105702642 [Orussus abietinus]XP_023289208.1 uncharacterized protein LOC105702642 [Orussus abietinus]XP_023289209.1 uncharacterized protein LOC105702642 [Orussus abietinus]XP_023289210.1 uncharacterized protein LOC105702642 [Orussus abietinus]
METVGTNPLHINESNTLSSGHLCTNQDLSEITREKEEELLYGAEDDGDEEETLSDDSLRLRLSDDEADLDELGTVDVQQCELQTEKSEPAVEAFTDSPVEEIPLQLNSQSSETERCETVGIENSTSEEDQPSSPSPDNNSLTDQKFYAEDEKMNMSGNGLRGPSIAHHSSPMRPGHEGRWRFPGPSRGRPYQNVRPPFPPRHHYYQPKTFYPNEEHYNSRYYNQYSCRRNRYAPPYRHPVTERTQQIGEKTSSKCYPLAKPAELAKNSKPAATGEKTSGVEICSMKPADLNSTKSLVKEESEENVKCEKPVEVLLATDNKNLVLSNGPCKQKSSTTENLKKVTIDVKGPQEDQDSGDKNKDVTVGCKESVLQENFEAKIKPEHKFQNDGNAVPSENVGITSDNCQAPLDELMPTGSDEVKTGRQEHSAGNSCDFNSGQIVLVPSYEDFENQDSNNLEKLSEVPQNKVDLDLEASKDFYDSNELTTSEVAEFCEADNRPEDGQRCSKSEESEQNDRNSSVTDEQSVQKGVCKEESDENGRPVEEMSSPEKIDPREDTEADEEMLLQTDDEQENIPGTREGVLEEEVDSTLKAQETSELITTDVIVEPMETSNTMEDCEKLLETARVVQEEFGTRENIHEEDNDKNSAMDTSVKQATVIDNNSCKTFSDTTVKQSEALQDISKGLVDTKTDEDSIRPNLEVSELLVKKETTVDGDATLEETAAHRIKIGEVQKLKKTMDEASNDSSLEKEEGKASLSTLPESICEAKIDETVLSTTEKTGANDIINLDPDVQTNNLLQTDDSNILSDKELKIEKTADASDGAKRDKSILKHILLSTTLLQPQSSDTIDKNIKNISPGESVDLNTSNKPCLGSTETLELSDDEDGILVKDNAELSLKVFDKSETDHIKQSQKTVIMDGTKIQPRPEAASSSTLTVNEKKVPTEKEKEKEQAQSLLTGADLSGDDSDVKMESSNKEGPICSEMRDMKKMSSSTESMASSDEDNYFLTNSGVKVGSDVTIMKIAKSNPIDESTSKQVSTSKRRSLSPLEGNTVSAKRPTDCTDSSINEDSLRSSPKTVDNKQNEISDDDVQEVTGDRSVSITKVSSGEFSKGDSSQALTSAGSSDGAVQSDPKTSLEDASKTDNSEDTSRAKSGPQRRSKRTKSTSHKSVEEDTQDPPSTSENVPRQKRKRRTARTAEEMIRKYNNDSDLESSDSLDKFVAVKLKSNSSARPTSPPALKRNLEDDDDGSGRNNPKKMRILPEPERNASERPEYPNSAFQESIKSLSFVKRFFLRDAKDKLAKLKQEEVEELLIQKLVETITMRAEIGMLREQVRISEKNQEATRARCQLLAKQVKDFEMVLTRNAADRRANNDRPVPPIKINRSVGLQVNFIGDHTIQSLRQIMQNSATKPTAIVNCVSSAANTEAAANGINQKRGIKVRSPRRTDAPPITMTTPPMQTGQLQTSPQMAVTPAALVMSKPIEAQQSISLQTSTNAMPAILPKPNTSPLTTMVRATGNEYLLYITTEHKT